MAVLTVAVVLVVVVAVVASVRARVRRRGRWCGGGRWEGGTVRWTSHTLGSLSAMIVTTFEVDGENIVVW